MIARLLARMLLLPKRQPLVKDPGDYGMVFEDVEFSSSDGVRLKAWLVRGRLDKLVIVTHPMPFTRYGFSVNHQGFMKVSCVEVELLKTVRALNDAGYNVLAFDFRNHGESGEGNGGVCGVGLEEWQDVVGAVDYASRNPELAGMSIGFVSHCMGANATIIALSKGLKGVKCVVAVQPVSMSVLVPCLMKAKYPLLLRLPGIVSRIDGECVRLGGHSLEDMSPSGFVEDVSVPVLYVQVRNDSWTRPEDVQGFFDGTPEPKELFWIEGDLERFDGYNFFGEHPERMLAFLKKYL